MLLALQLLVTETLLSWRGGTVPTSLTNRKDSSAVLLRVLLQTQRFFQSRKSEALSVHIIIHSKKK